MSLRLVVVIVVVPLLLRTMGTSVFDRDRDGIDDGGLDLCLPTSAATFLDVPGSILLTMWTLPHLELRRTLASVLVRLLNCAPPPSRSVDGLTEPEEYRGQQARSRALATLLDCRRAAGPDL